MSPLLIYDPAEVWVHLLFITLPFLLHCFLHVETPSAVSDLKSKQSMYLFVSFSFHRNLAMTTVFAS